jgi:hypothetical protein
VPSMPRRVNWKRLFSSFDISHLWVDFVALGVGQEIA